MKMLLSSSSRSRLTAQAWAVRAACIAAVVGMAVLKVFTGVPRSAGKEPIASLEIDAEAERFVA